MLTINYNKDDVYYTPSLVLLAILPKLKEDWIIYDPSAGKGHITDFLKEKGFKTIESDIESGEDFLSCNGLFDKPKQFDCIVTNPPYSLKTDFLQKAIEIKKPFALLMPTFTLETKKRIKLICDNDIQIISFGKRFNFIKDGITTDRVPFEVHWFCYQLNLPKQLNYFE